MVSVCARLENGIEWPFWALLIHLALNGDEILVAEKFSVGTSHPEYSKVQDVRDLVPLLLGDKGPTPPILIRAKAGTGKTWSARQLVRALSTQIARKLLNENEKRHQFVILPYAFMRG